MIWRLVEHNGWYNVGSSIENCLMLMKFQVFLDYERFHTFRRLGYIIKWMVVKIWICLLHILAFLAQIPNRGYKELGNKVICSDVIESGFGARRRGGGGGGGGDELFPATLREIKLQTQIDGLQSQVTELHKAQNVTAENPIFSQKLKS
ncbi:hypothetical protein YC2023_098891 [Brassica napus]